MQKRKIYLMVSVFCAIALGSGKAAAQLRAQSDLFGVLQNTCSYYLDVTANDHLDSLPIQQLMILRQPQYGAAFVNGNYISYCPVSNFIGADHFKYMVKTSANNIDSATVYINVMPSNNMVFAGDADQNGQVENFDVLALGLTYNFTGPSRFDSVSTSALAWASSSFINSNPGAADCDGNGIVDAADLQVIEAYYHAQYPVQRPYEVDTAICRNNAIPFYIQSFSGDTLRDGDTLDIAIKLGAEFTMNEAYGIAFTLQADTSIFSLSNVVFNTSSSWLLQNDSGLFFKRAYQHNGEIEVALTKTNHTSSLGGGELLRARLPIDDNIDGIVSAPGSHPLRLLLKKARVITAYDIMRDLCIAQPALTYFKNYTGIISNENIRVKIYPNPANNLLFIEAENLNEIEITDLTGRKIYRHQENPTSRVALFIDEIAPVSGTYFIKIKTKEFVSVQKIIVQH